MAYKKKAVLALCLALGIFVLAFAKDIYAQVCQDNPPLGPVVIYEDSLLPGWSNAGSWPSNLPITVNSTPTYRWGNYALQVQYNQTNAGIEFYRYSVDVNSSRDYLSFRVRKEDSSGMISVTGHRIDNSLGNYVSLADYLVPGQTGSSFTTGQWYSVRIPFSAMGITSGTNLQGIIFLSSTSTTAYFDQIVLLPGLTLGYPLHSEVSGSGTGWTPWNAHITSGFDHSMTATYGNDQWNTIVTAWTGEIGNGTGYSSDPTCKPKTASDQYGSDFHLNGYYVGATSCGGVSYLSYDGHPGIDYKASDGTSVYAAEAGTIIANDDGTFDCPSNGASCVGQRSQYGRIRIRHSNTNGYTTWYMHLSTQVGGLSPGSTVTKGQLIGFSGHTSKPTEPVSPHLHFQVTTGDKLTSTPIDPYGWEGLYTDPYSGDNHPVFNSRQWE